MKSKWLIFITLLLVCGLASDVFAKEEVWKDSQEKFSNWKKIIVVDLQLSAELEEDKLMKNILEEEWNSQFLDKINSKHVEKIPFSEALAYLMKKNNQILWQELWEEDQEKFFKEASPYWQNYADGILVSKVMDYKKETRWKAKRSGGLLNTIGIGVSIPVGNSGVSVGTSGNVGSSSGGKEIILLSAQGEFQLFNLAGDLKWMSRISSNVENKEVTTLVRKIFQTGGKKIPLKR